MSVSTLSVHRIKRITTQVVLMDGLSTLDIVLHGESGDAIYRLVAFGIEAVAPVMVHLPLRDDRRELAR